MSKRILSALLLVAIAAITGCDRDSPPANRAHGASVKRVGDQRTAAADEDERSTPGHEDDVIDDPTQSAVWATAQIIRQLADHHLDQENPQ